MSPRPCTRSLPGRLMPLLVLMLAVAPALQAMPARAAQPLRLPFEARIESVIEEGEIEGRPVRIARFRSALPPGELVRVLRREWPQDDGTELLESASGSWRIVSGWNPEGFRTLQFRALPGGGSEGVLSVWPREPGAAGLPVAAFDLAALLPAGSTVMRRFAARDAGRRSETLVAVAQTAVEATADAIDQRLVALGLRRDPVAGTASARGWARIYRGRAVELACTLVPRAGHTEVVLHLTGGAQ